jgi:hypothetical protein
LPLYDNDRLPPVRVIAEILKKCRLKLTQP